MSNSKRNWAKFGVRVKLIVILPHIIAYFSINIRWHSQNVSSDSRKWLIKHLFPPSSCKKQINKQNSYLLLAFLHSGSVPELDMHESKHFLPGQFVHSVVVSCKKKNNISLMFVSFFYLLMIFLVSFRFCCVSFRFVSFLLYLHSFPFLFCLFRFVSFLFRFLFYNHPFTKAIWL